jgi:hypothetical protein
MHRTVFFLATASAVLIPLPSARVTDGSEALKNPMDVRVTSVGEIPAKFTVVRRAGFIQLADRLARRPPDTLHSVTPQRLVGSGGEFLFLAGEHRTIRVEAWRRFGQTEHVVGEGQRIIVRAPMAQGPPEIVVDTVGARLSQK